MQTTRWWFWGLLTACTLAFPKWHDEDGVLARFRNLSGKHRVTLWWINPDFEPDESDSIAFFGTLEPNGGSTAFTAYGKFFWAYEGQENSDRRSPFVIEGDKLLYLFYDDTADPHLLSEARAEVAWLHSYHLSHQRHWLSPFRRPPPRLPFLKQSSFTSLSSHCTCTHSRSECQKRGVPLHLPIERVHSHHPDLFKVSNFLSEEEAEHLIILADSDLAPSTTESTGGVDKVDSTRDSESAWVAMNRTWVVEAIYQRIGDMLGLDPVLLTAAAATIEVEGEIRGVASHLEVTRFTKGGHYYQHYDNSPGTDFLLNFVTVQLVLQTTKLRGGETTFPHSIDSESDDRFGVVTVISEPLSAVFWYNLQVDGNIDEASMYAHEAVISGEQFLAHVNIWDPHLPSSGDPNTPHDKIYLSHDEL